MTTKFTLETSNDYLTSRAGLIIIGQLLAATHLNKRLNRSVIDEVKVPLISHADNVRAYLGLLCQGKSDFDHIEPFRQDTFFPKALGIHKMTSAPTMRQRFDQAASSGAWQTILLEESADLLKRVKAPLTPLQVNVSEDEVTSYMPLDLDVSPFDNSGTKKEGVSRTYKGFDGYSPFFAYLGQEGYCVNVSLREGKTHVQKEADDFIDMALRYARRVTDTKLLLRMDSGNDAADNINLCLDHEVDFIIKRNPRKEQPERWLELAKREGRCVEVRPGKHLYIGNMIVQPERFIKPVRLIYHVVERTTERDGQVLLVPDIGLALFWTTLTDVKEEQIVELYKDHATSEQFHSEIKSELDLERMPSGKFATNDLILHLGVFAYNLLRIVGQIALTDQDAPRKKKAVFRQRIRTVIQDLMLISARMVTHARRFKLCFGRWSPWFPQLRRLYIHFS